MVVVSLGVCEAQEENKPEKLAERVEALLDAPLYKEAHWGVLVVDAKTGDTLYERNAQKLMAPASLTKLVTTACSLQAFGAKYTFETPVFALGKTKDGVFDGNLVLVASGDPSFCGRPISDSQLKFENTDHTYANSGLMECVACECDPRTTFDELAQTIADSGIKELRGDVLIDDRLFAISRSSGSGPEVVSPICINDNVIDVIITPAKKPGDAATVVFKPESKAISLDAQILTGEESDSVTLDWAQISNGKFAMRGKVPAQGKPVLRILPVDDPTALARTMFIEALQRAKIQVSALAEQPSGASLPPLKAYMDQLPIAMHRSAPMGEILKVTLKTSHNLYASMLPCLLAAKSGKQSMADGLRLQKPILKEYGLSPDRLSLGSGAGGVLSDQLTPQSLVQLLSALAKKPTWDDYKNWLPELGHDGTLADLVDNKHRLYRKVFAKTGTYVWTDALNARPFLRTKALAGTMTTHSGRELYFAFIVNDVLIDPTTSVKAVSADLIKLCDLFYDE
jgi:D-alanyl-D-alanine carboxypeptidase/D-alanyl-D-alanine-endopeptidase (penicillin-binding protein 4)